MEEEKETSHTPVLPFDSSMYDSFVIYDNPSYVCDRDMCRGSIRMSSGNLIKYYSYQMDSKKVPVSIA
ncbi:MAG: hypothetical protein ACI4FZ_10475 [Lachnospiraceae bacterium]